ncbi:hypothetical protein ES703_01392 [subsurface metagenome]|nr:isoprenylcysteine carboxylmethyltransferase family protein [bacterium]
MERQKRPKVTTRGIIGALMSLRAVIIGGACFFLAAWKLNIVRGWIYFGMALVGALAGAIIMITCIPGLAHERAKAKEGTKTWDKILLSIYFILGLIVMPALAGLDVGRFCWTLLPAYFVVIGIAVYVFAFALTLWAMLSNPFFESTVRIQKDRDQKVISTGPYRFVRHPGYVGMLIGSLHLPFVIGSMYALIPAGVMIILAITRTYLEDKTLQEELNGYKEYAAKVKYRLFPGIW